jgi:hypothetical protein
MGLQTTNANAKKSKKEITLYRIKIALPLKRTDIVDRTDTLFEKLYKTKAKKVAMGGYYFNTLNYYYN